MLTYICEMQHTHKSLYVVYVYVVLDTSVCQKTNSRSTVTVYSAHISMKLTHTFGKDA